MGFFLSPDSCFLSPLQEPPVTSREILTWKFPFYRGFLPALRRLGPARADATLDALGRASTLLWPPRRLAFLDALTRAREVFHHPSDASVDPGSLAAGVLRFLARDYLLDTPDDAEALVFSTSPGPRRFPTRSPKAEAWC